jgi:aspartyl-tRNA synthetase
MLDLTGVANAELLLWLLVSPDSTSKLLGQLRLNLAKKDALLSSDDYEFTWVVDFPLVEFDAEEKRYVYVHHPFTSPHDDDLAGSSQSPAPYGRRHTTWC